MPKTKQDKIDWALKMIPSSPALGKLLPISSDQWGSFLTALDEDNIDDLLLLLEEEHGMLSDIEKKRLRKKEVNKTRYLQRMEKLNIRMEEISNNPGDNV